ncbi:CHASE domain-containing protein [Cellvibrio sp. NN19]|uniref:CHASE domain-containing protein n=1 Tax=Cellvibrio chitinivorans TaxID=3102792 RepID=UPI002B414059|nr:CHASE domain-containing protein [Cellvibrio sp. NN19]
MVTGLPDKFSHPPATVIALRIVLLALAYLVAGRLSLLLAIPPGFVSGLFLPMGVALGALLIWGLPMSIGVFLGSTLLNISINPAPTITFQSILVAMEIACASTLAGVVGALLIRRFVGFPNSLTDERQIFAFFILGGPVATSLSATIGVIVLYANGIIPLKQMLYSWWTWWIGDAIGVLIATPLMCVIFARPRHLWRGRRLTVGVPLIVSSLIVVVVFVMSSNNEQRKLNRQFEEQAGLVAGAIDNNLSSVDYTLSTLRGLFVASEEVTRAEFSHYVNEVIIKKQGIAGLSWNQRVFHADRAAYEAKIRAESSGSFSIKEKNAAGDFIVAPERAEYLSITYVEPWQKNATILGFNVFSDATREEAAARARDTGHFAMTRPLHLLQEEKLTPGVVMFCPVYKNRYMTNSVLERRDLLVGFAAAIVRTDELVEVVRSTYSSGDYQLRIVDITEGKPIIFYRGEEQPIPAYARELIFTKEILVGGRQLLISIGPTEKFLTEHVSLQSWFVLAGGLLFCSLLGGFLLLISGRTQHISNLVEQRTKELAAILENAVESILVADEQGAIQQANPAAASLFKYPLEQLFSLNIADLVPALRHSLNEYSEHLATANVREMLGRCSDGNDLEIEMSVSPVDIQERKLFTFIIHDASAKRRVERLKGEFISTVSHELRTPLTSIKGALSIVLSGSLGEMADKIRDLLVIANTNVDRLARLVNDILDVDKLEFGKVQLNLRQSVVYPLVQQSIEQNHGYADRYGVKLQLEVPTEATMQAVANIDPDRFLQVMANLISNAIKFSYLDGVVRIEMRCDEHSLTITVIDEGQGIAENFRARIFQRFAQVDSSDTRRRDGTGLGLSITKVIIERMGGSIDYSSILGKGSRFFFTLPIVQLAK